MNTCSEELCDRVLKLLDRLRLAYAAFADARGITKAQLLTLYVISEAGELPMSRLACSLHCDASNVTGLVDRLVAQGLLTRSEDVRDRRVKALKLTPRGEKIMFELKASLPEATGCKNLSHVERQTLLQLLEKMAGS